MITQAVDNLPASYTERPELFIGGWAPTTGHERGIVRSPGTAEPSGSAVLGMAGGIDLAVVSARRTLDPGSWHLRAAAERAEILDRAADILEVQPDMLALLVTAELGCPRSFARRVSVLPEGVLSIVPAGREVGEHLVTHPLIGKVAFTGSTAAGKRAVALCAGRGARLTQSRVLVSEARKQALLDALAGAFNLQQIGDSLDTSADIGPLVAQRQRDRVEGYVALGRSEGARPVTGSERPRASATSKTPCGSLARRSSDPVISVLSYSSDDEAVAITNDSVLGLSGSVWSADEQRAITVARQLRTGRVSINGRTQAFGCPLGGFKQSGVGQELSPEGFDAYLEVHRGPVARGPVPEAPSAVPATAALR